MGCDVNSSYSLRGGTVILGHNNKVARNVRQVMGRIVVTARRQYGLRRRLPYGELWSEKCTTEVAMPF
jgi:hypothetical protein